MRKDDNIQEKINKLENTIGKIDDIKQTKKKTPTFLTIEVVILLVITMAVSLLMGVIVTYKFCVSKVNFVDEPLQEFIKNYDYIVDNYYQDVNEEELLDAALDGMLKKLDNNSVYLDEISSDNFNKQLSGSYEGFGIEVYNNNEGDIVVNDVYKSSSADEKGLKQGDVITKFFDKNLKNVSTADFVDMVQKTSDKNIKITYKRNGKEKNVVLKKKTVSLVSVVSNIIDEKNKIGYIAVSIFAENTDKQFKEQLKKLEQKNIESLIIDLRSNSGGHLTTASNMISQFLDSSHVIYQTKIKNKQIQHFSTGKKNKNYNIVVLVNNQSASASEIMASALSEQRKAIIVGEKTYGKGTVQELQNLPNGDKYKITTKEWLTSKGKVVEGKGVHPDVEEKLNDIYYTQPVIENDNQLQAAIKVLKK